MFHLKDFAFSLLVPRRYPICQRSLAFRYRVLQEAIGDALVSAFPNLKGIACLEGSLVAGPFCMAKPTTCDLVFAGQKIAGAAQRLTKQGMLYQAAVSVHTPKKEFFRSIIKDLSWADLLIQEGKIGQPISPQQRQQLKTQICMYIDRVGLYF